MLSSFIRFFSSSPLLSLSLARELIVAFLREPNKSRSYRIRSSYGAELRTGRSINFSRARSLLIIYDRIYRLPLYRF